jgi:hypothetical protein
MWTLHLFSLGSNPSSVTYSICDNECLTFSMLPHCQDTYSGDRKCLHPEVTMIKWIHIKKKLWVPTTVPGMKWMLQEILVAIIINIFCQIFSINAVCSANTSLVSLLENLKSYVLCYSKWLECLPSYKILFLQGRSHDALFVISFYNSRTLEQCLLKCYIQAKWKMNKNVCV